MAIKTDAKTKAAEYKAFPVVVTEVDEAQGIVKAFVSVFGVIDDGDDVIHPGSFVKTLAERLGRVRVLNSHNARDVINVVGKPIAAREVGRDELPDKVLAKFPESTGGLYTETQYLLSDPTSKAVFDRIAADFVNEYSIGYDPIQVDYGKVQMPDGKTKTVRNIREIRLWEYSPVVWGMNPATATVDAKDAAESDKKEYTPDGPVRRLGDCLLAEMQKTMHRMLDGYLADGYVNSDEYAQLNTLCGSAIDTVKAGLPDDVSLRPMASWMDMWMWLGSDGADAEKAGRALLAPVQEASTMLQSLLKTSGVDVDTTPPDTNAEAQAGPSQDQDEKQAPTSIEAGPQTETPTTTNEALLLEIDLLCAELEMVKL